MLLIVGALIVIGSVLGGYLMHGRAPAGAQSAGRSSHHRRRGPRQPPHQHASVSAQGLDGADAQPFFAPGWRKTDYKELLAMLYQLFSLVQQTGVMALESHFDAPASSPIMSKYPRFLKRHHAVDFLADSIKVMIDRRHRSRTISRP